MPTKILLFIAALSLLANVFLGYQTLKNKGPKESLPEQFLYLSKRIFAENQNDILINFIPLRTSLREYVQKLPDPVGVYFEYLPSGTSIGVNDTEPFFGASLVKTPIVMKVYKLIEQGKLTKDKEITIELHHIDKNFGSLWRSGLGTTITLGEAIRLAVVESDNTAEKILREQIKDDPFSEVYDYIDIKPGAKITPKNFSSMLRSLYLSAYLLREHSNEILQIMATSPFDDKLVAGVPNDIKVAHKIGLYQPNNNNGAIHSDCGIVYVPNRPYILCMMAKSDEEKAREYMREISKTVYEYIVAVNGEN